MSRRSYKPRPGRKGSTMVYTEVQNLDQACELVAHNKPKRKPRSEAGRRRLIQQMLMCVSTISTKPVTLPKIIMKEVKW